METYYERNKEKLKARARENYQRNAAKRRAGVAAYREDNPEVARRARAKYEQKNPDKVREVKARSQSRPESLRKRADRQRVRRAKTRGAGATEYVDRTLVLSAHGGICGICGDPVDPADWHLDHIVPLTKGGPHTYENVQPTHPVCNMRKGGQ